MQQSRSISTVGTGDEFDVSKPVVTTEQLARYAGASGDFNRIHYDQDFAREAGLGGVIAHGMLTMGFLAQAVTDWAGRGAVVRAIRSKFHAPVRPGDVVAFHGRVTACAAADRKCDLDLTGQVGDRIVISGAATVILPDA